MTTKYTLVAMRSAVKIDEQYAIWDLDDSHNRSHTFRPERLKALAAIIDQEITAERDRLRGALVDCEKVMNVSANQLCKSASSTELSAINKHLVECVIRTRAILAPSEPESGAMPQKAKR